MGTVVVSESDYGLVFTPALTGLKPGGQGFHVHENPSCESSMKEGKSVPAGAAGSHYDPKQTGNHGYPWDDDAHMGRASCRPFLTSISIALSTVDYQMTVFHSR